MPYPDNFDNALFERIWGPSTSAEVIREAIDVACEQAIAMMSEVRFTGDKSSAHRWRAIDAGFRLMTNAYPYKPDTSTSSRLANEIQYAFDANVDGDLEAVKQNLTTYATILKGAL